MLSRRDIIGKKIRKILGDSSQSDSSHNFTDFAFVLENGLAFRMPWDADTKEELLQQIELVDLYGPLSWPESKLEYYEQNLWNSRITDILIPIDPEERFPDTGCICLDSGCYIEQISSGATGIAPMVFVLSEKNNLEEFVSVWDAIVDAS